jgi:hypothetical protein
MKAFTIMGRVLKAAYDDLFLCVFLSVAWWACPIVLLLVIGALAEYGAGSITAFSAALGLAGIALLLLLVLAAQPPVVMGIQHVANRLANYKRADSGFFWEGLRYQIRRGYLLFLACLGIPAAIAFNFVWYFNSQGWWQIISVIWLWLFLFSLMAGQYVFPLFWQQDEPNVWLAIRNALLLALQNPLYSFLMLLFQLILLLISVALTLPLILLAPALLALTGNYALTGLLQEMGLAPQPPDAPLPG